MGLMDKVKAQATQLADKAQMAWDFTTEPEFAEKLEWMDSFVRDEVEPLDLVWGDRTFHPLDDTLRKVVGPLKQRVRAEGLWACHLGPELGGSGYGQVKLALMNEILGRSRWGPIVFGCQAPDTGNAEIIAHYGTEEQKERYLRPLLEGELFSSYSMTEPQGGSDPTQFTTRRAAMATNGSSTAGSSSRPTPARRRSSSSWP
jgi:acyl-CoA dehydrogenase